MRRQTGSVLFVAAWLAMSAALVPEYARWAGHLPPSPARPYDVTIVTPTRLSVAGRASVIDGDTIEIRGQRIRLWGIDAPESRQPCYIEGKPWRCGQQAALALSDWIGQRTVTCSERDRERDRYRRIVAACSVDGQDMGAWLVRNGWALDWPQYSYGAYAADQAEAAGAKRGIWQGEFEKPWEWRRQ